MCFAQKQKQLLFLFPCSPRRYDGFGYSCAAPHLIGLLRSAGFRKLVTDGIKFRTAEPQHPKKSMTGFSTNFSIGLPLAGATMSSATAGINKKRKNPSAAAAAASSEAAGKKLALALAAAGSSVAQFVGYGAPSTLQLRGLREAASESADPATDEDDIAAVEEEEEEEAATTAATRF